MVTFFNPVTQQEISYHIDKRMIRFLDTKVRDKISKVKDQDYVLLIDGYEGSGKSTFAMQIGKYIDPSLDLSRICMTADEFRAAVLHADKGQCVIYDEAVTGLTSSDSIARVGKMLKSLMMQMRQKNLFVIVILPTMFEFGRYAVLSRARSFFHIYECHGRKGYFAGYNRKTLRLVYMMGRKTYSYRIRTRFIGRFYGKYVVDEELYRKKKEQALSLIDKPEQDAKEERKSEEDFVMGCIQENLPDRVAERLSKSTNTPMGRDKIAIIKRQLAENNRQKAIMSVVGG